MRRSLVSAIPLFVAAAAFVLASPVISAQQEHNHSATADGAQTCACCGNSGTGTTDHAAGGGCCSTKSAAQAAPAAGQATPLGTEPQAMNHGSGCCGSMDMGKGEGSAMAMPMGDDPSMMADMHALHFLLDNRADIRRIVAVLPNGIDTLTESDKPEIAATLKTHVAAMYARLKDGRGIHQHDPLFQALFAHADQIETTITYTESGVRVVETSTDPAVAKLLHRHAEVVDGFIKNGMTEMMKNHPID